MRATPPPPPPEPPSDDRPPLRPHPSGRCRLCPPAPSGEPNADGFINWLSTQPTWCRYDVQTLTRLMTDLNILLTELMRDTDRRTGHRWETYVSPAALHACSEPADLARLREDCIGEVTAWRTTVAAGINWLQDHPAQAEQLRTAGAGAPAPAPEAA